jgi:hypothetical protein
MDNNEKLFVLLYNLHKLLDLTYIDLYIHSPKPSWRDA